MVFVWDYEWDSLGRYLGSTDIERFKPLSTDAKGSAAVVWTRRKERSSSQSLHRNDAALIQDKNELV